MAVLAVRAAAQEPVQEAVSVSRVEVTLHVNDRSGTPIPDLETRDFSLKVDGQRVPIESVEWVASSDVSTTPSREITINGAPAPSPPAGRLIVMMFQREIGGQKEEGLMRMKRQALEFVGSLKPDDKVAVLGMSSRLWLRLDFTTDRAAIRGAIADAFLQQDAPRPSDPPEPSIASHISVEDERGATSIEKALGVVGRALRPLPGSKAVLFFGWGVGRWNALSPSGNYHLGGMVYSEDFERAREALSAAQAPVFTLDVSSGPHRLEEGLRKLSFDTGGFYVPTYQHPGWAMQTVASAIAGHYVLVFDRPRLPPGLHTIEISTPRRGVALLYRQSYED